MELFWNAAKVLATDAFFEVLSRGGLERSPISDADADDLRHNIKSLLETYGISCESKEGGQGSSPVL